MNIFKKIYCRVFQGAFRLALPILPYREPKVYEDIEEIPNLLKELRVNSVLLVTDAGLKKVGATDRLERILKDNDIKCVVYDKTNANPTINNVEDALKLFNDEKCEAIIAFGGGSPMDCAKAVAARVVCPNKTLNSARLSSLRFE